MRAFLAAAWLFAWTPAPAAVVLPPAVEEVFRQADDHPRQALAAIQRQTERAEREGDADGRFWWPLAAAHVLARLERHGEAVGAAAAASGALRQLPAADEARRLWAQLAELDASAGTAEPTALLPRVAAVRQRADAVDEPRLSCEAYALELYLLLNLRSDDEAWLAAEGVERCGQRIGTAEMVATAQLAFATLGRFRLSDGIAHARPQAHLERALQVLGERPARFQRSLIEWEAGITLRHLKEHEAALDRLQRARALSVDLQDDAGVAAANLEMAAVLLELNRPAQMLPLLDEAPRLLTAGGEGDLAFRMPRVMELRILALDKLGRTQVLGEVELARRWAGPGAAPTARAKLLHAMAQALANQGRHAAAYQTLREAVDAEQQSRSAARDAQMLRLQARYDSARRDAENAELRLKTEAARLQLETEAERRRTLTVGFVALAALTLLAFMLAGRQLLRRRRMAELALRDELTGVPNRRAVLAYAREQFNQARRLGVPLTVALIDLDHFKRINDSHGHAAGDEVLRAFARAASAVLRGQDRLGRWGGEEWLLVMPGTHLDETEAVFARLRQRFTSAAVPGLPADARCTFSMGAAEHGPAMRDIDAMIAAADRALYAAKHRGRDRLEREPLEAPPPGPESVIGVPTV